MPWQNGDEQNLAVRLQRNLPFSWKSLPIDPIRQNIPRRKEQPEIDEPLPKCVLATEARETTTMTKKKTPFCFCYFEKNCVAAAVVVSTEKFDEAFDLRVFFFYWVVAVAVVAALVVPPKDEAFDAIPLPVVVVVTLQLVVVAVVMLQPVVVAVASYPYQKSSLELPLRRPLDWP